MLPGPILRREVRAASSKRDLYVLRTVLGSTLGISLVAMGATVLRGDMLTRSVFPAAGLKGFGLGSMVAVIAIEIMLLGFFIPAVVGGTIAEERERDTLNFLLLSRLTRTEIVLVKLIGRLVPALTLAMVSVPFVAFSSYLWGEFPEVALVAMAGVASTTVTMGSIAIFASARHSKVGSAHATAMLLIWSWLIFTPVMAELPISRTPFLSEVSMVSRGFGRVIGPSSPLSLVVGSVTRRTLSAETLAWNVSVMAAYQAGLSLTAVAMAIHAMKRQEPRRIADDPRHAYRPACGDDPIFWREFDLPNRTGAPPKFLMWGRQLAALLRLLLTVLLQLVGLMIAIGMPLVLVYLTVKLGAPAFREAWQGGPTKAREEFNFMISGVSVLLAMIGLLGCTSASAARITTERDKSTWSPLLTTPLDGAEILGAKMRSTVWGLFWSGPVLLVLWLLGALSGSIHPIGPLFAGLNLAAGVWFGVAFGTWLGVRPGATSTANSWSALGALGLAVVNAPYMLVSLTYRPPGASFWQLQGPWASAGAWFAYVSAPLVVAGFARRLTRRTFDRFDAYVDRPRRGPRP